MVGGDCSRPVSWQVDNKYYSAEVQFVACSPDSKQLEERGWEAIVLLTSLDKVYSGPPVLWMPWGPGNVSFIEGCPHFRSRFILRTHISDIVSVIQRCPYFRSILLRGVPTVMLPLYHDIMLYI